MQFLYQALAWGFLLTMVPVLIHLINMMRHRKVKWAAMDFLLASYRKHRKWVWLKQLLLLLARMLAVALIVAMLAQWITRGQWAGLLGGKVTHNYILLDDSGSMSEEYGEATAFEVANRFLQQLAVDAAEQKIPQRFTVIRFSRAAAGNADTQAAELADLNAEPVDGQFPELMEKTRNQFDVTQLASGPGSAIEVVRQMFDASPDESRVVYLLSDFRSGQWGTPAELRESLKELEEADAKIQLIQCAKQQVDNLGIVDIQPANETRAAEVPLYVNVRVKNYNDQPVENVQLRIRTALYDNDDIERGDMTQPTPNVEDLPIAVIDRLEPGQIVTKQVQVYFPKSGSHVVQASLPEDGLSMDNHRWCVVTFPDSEPVLIVDGQPNQLNAFYLQRLFQPDQRAQTGIRPVVQPIAYLRDSSPEQLAEYRMMFLCDVPRLDERAVENLERFVRQGGGVAFFVGDQVNMLSYNQDLYRDGQGILPLALARDGLLAEDDFDEAPDIDVEGSKHPVFRELVAGRNPLIRMVRVEKYLRPADDWTPDPDSTEQIIARLRNQDPLVVEKQFGDGRVIMFLTSFGPYWNDLALSPNALLALKLQSYLAAPLRSVEQYNVGTEIDTQWDKEKFQGKMRVFLPDKLGEELTVVEKTATGDSDAGTISTAIDTNETSFAGIYEVWASTPDGKVQAKRFGLNVDPAESELALADSTEMLSRLMPVKPEFRSAEDYGTSTISPDGFNRSLLLMCALVALLLGEQWLAYSASYHPAKGAAS